MIEEIFLYNLNMDHFTILDAELHCKIFDINPDDIKTLDLDFNDLTDISGISIFKNLQFLYLRNNDITDLSSLINLINLKGLYITNLNLTDELKAVNILKNLPKLKELHCHNTFKTVKIRKELKGTKIKILY